MEPLRHQSSLPIAPNLDYLDEVLSLMAEGAHGPTQIRPVVSYEPVRLVIHPGTPLEEIVPPVGATPAQIACDLAFRPLEDALRIAWKWLATGEFQVQRMGFRRDVYPHSNLRPGLPRIEDGPQALLHHLVCMRESIYRTIEATLRRVIGELDERIGKGSAAQGGVSKKPVKAYYQAPDPTSAESNKRVLVSFEGATEEEIEAFVVPYGRPIHGGKTSESNTTLEARSDRAQLLEQVEHWRLHDEWVRERAMHVAEVERQDGAYWEALTLDPLVAGLDIPRFSSAYSQFAQRNPFPRFDKDEQLRNDNVARSTVLVAPNSPIMLLRREYNDTLNDVLRDTVLVDFMDTVRYMSVTQPSMLVMPATAHWMPEAEPSTEWERSRAMDISLDPSSTLFEDLSSWTTKTCQHLDRRNAQKQGEKARVLIEALKVRIDRAMICLTYAQPSVAPAPEKYGWHTARAVCLNRSWTTGQTFGVNAANNYLVLAAIFYRVNHGLEEMQRNQSIVDTIDSARYHADHRGADSDTALFDSNVSSARLAAMNVAMEEAQRDSTSPQFDANMRDDDVPPPNWEEELNPDGSDPTPVLLAQYHFRMDSTSKRINEHRAKMPSKNAEQEAALDRLHAWKRFVYAHIPLIRALLDGERCDDAYALDQDLSAGRLSRLTLNYPCADLAPGEEQMRNLHDCLRIADAIYTVPSGSAAGTATATTAAQVTARAGADEAVVEEEIFKSGVVPAMVLTAQDTSVLAEGEEPPKKRRGRPPKNAPKPPPGSAARKPSGGRRPKKPAAGPVGRPPKKPAVSNEPGVTLPVPLPLDARVDDPNHQQALEGIKNLFEQDPDIDGADDLDGLFDDDPAAGVAGANGNLLFDTNGRLGVENILNNQADAPDDDYDPYAIFVSGIEASRKIQEAEDAEKARISSMKNVTFGRNGAMGIAVGSSERTTSGGAPGASNQLRPRLAAYSNPWVAFFRKIQLRPCVHREWSSRCDQISLAHPECYDFVLHSMLASMLGLYRTCRNPAPLGLAIKMYRATDLAMRYDAPRHVMLAIMFAHSDLIIASLREALVRQMEYDPVLWMMKGDWIRGSTHVARAVFHMRNHIGTVESVMDRGYGAQSIFAGTESLPATLAIATGEPVSKGDPAVSSTIWVAGMPAGVDPNAVPSTPQTPFFDQDNSSMGYGPATTGMSGAAASTATSNGTTQQGGGTQRVQVILPSVPHRPSIYRVQHPNFIPYMDWLFRFVSAEAVLVSASRRLVEYNRIMDSLSPEQQAEYAVSGVKRGPSVYRLSEATVQLIMSEAQHSRPGADIPMLSLRRIGVSLTGCSAIRQARDLFIERVHDQSVRTLISGMTAMDFELCAVFFRFLGIHSQRTVVPLDPSMTRRQAIALRKKWSIPDNEPIPLHALSFSVCSIAACRGVCNMLVPQTQSTRSFGQFWAAVDYHLGGMTCLSKKCIGVGYRNTVAPPELRHPWYHDLKRTEPGETVDAKCERLSKVFFGQFQALGEDPVYEFEDARQRTYPSQAGEIATRIVIFAEAVKKATGGKARAEPMDLLSEDVLKEKLKRYAGPDQDPAQVEAAMATFGSLRDMCTRESRQRDESQYTMPCYRSLLTLQPALGYVCGLEGTKITPYTPCTVCPGCGALTPYSVSSPLYIGPNGPTCGVCDWTERQRAMTPQCLICCQRGMELTTTSKGHKGLRFAKDLRQIYVLDDLTGKALEWRTGFVCTACYNQCTPWIAMELRDYEQSDAPLRPVPLYASHIAAGFVHDFFTGGRDNIRQCADISTPSRRIVKTQTVNGVTRPSFPPHALAVVLNQWSRGVTRAYLKAKNKRDKYLARLAKRAGRTAGKTE